MPNIVSQESGQPVQLNNLTCFGSNTEVKSTSVTILTQLHSQDIDISDTAVD